MTQPEMCDFGCGDTGTHFCMEWDAWSCNTCCDTQNEGISFPDCPRFDDDGNKIKQEDTP